LCRLKINVERILIIKYHFQKIGNKIFTKYLPKCTASKLQDEIQAVGRPNHPKHSFDHPGYLFFSLLAPFIYCSLIELRMQTLISSFPFFSFSPPSLLSRVQTLTTFMGEYWASIGGMQRQSIPYLLFLLFPLFSFLLSLPTFLLSIPEYKHSLCLWENPCVCLLFWAPVGGQGGCRGKKCN
jgi:hypothetical protein